MQNLRTTTADPQPPAADGPSIIEDATNHLWRSIRARGAAGEEISSLGELPLDAAGKYLVVWPGAPGCRNQLVAEAAGSAGVPAAGVPACVEAAGAFAAGFGWPQPRLFVRSDLALFVKTGAGPYASFFYVMAATTPAAHAVSAYLRRARALHPDVHGGFLARIAEISANSSPFIMAQTVVVERVPKGHGFVQRCILDQSFSGRTAEDVAATLNTDLRMAREISSGEVAA